MYKKHPPFLVLLFLALMLFTDHALAQASLKSDIRLAIRNKINTEIQKKWFTCHGEMICGISLIPSFYKKRDYEPAWMKNNSGFFAAKELIKAIYAAEDEGLNPENYHLHQIETLLSEIQHNKNMLPSVKADLDILLTDAFLLYASHLISGRVNPETIHSQWEAYTPDIDLAKVLNIGLDTNKIMDNLHRLMPQHPGYESMKETLKKYRKIADQGQVGRYRYYQRPLA